jgi:hypothetical protein
MYIQSTTFLLVLLLGLQAGQLAPNPHVGNNSTDIKLYGKERNKLSTFASLCRTIRAEFGVSLLATLSLNN